MLIVAWILIVLGVLAFLGGLYIAIREQLKSPPSITGKADGTDLENLAELVKNLAALIEQFAKLSTGIQWAILGLISIAAGVYVMP